MNTNINDNNTIIPVSDKILIAIILFFGVLIRLINISQPFVDVYGWRQSDMAMIAENFFRHGYTIFYPQINWAGTAPGYVGTEFPLVPFFAALLYPFLGVQDWIGRAISIFFFATSVPFIYLLVKKTDNERTALFVVTIYSLIPLGIFTSRSFMSDMAAVSFSIAALYLFLEWLEKPSPLRFICALICTSLAILLKLTSIVIGVPMLYLAWEKYHARLFFRPKLWIFAVLSLVLPVAWYFHSFQVAISHYPYHWFGQGGAQIVSFNSYINIVKLTMTSSLNPIIFSLFIFGIFIPSSKNYGYVFHWWLIAIIFFVIIAGEGNHRHPWYQLPLVPVAAILAGRICNYIFYNLMQLTNSRIIVLLPGIFLFAAIAFASYLFVKPNYYPWTVSLFKAGMELNQIAQPDELVLVADQGYPAAIYYSRRKGWHFLEFFGSKPLDSLEAIRELKKRKEEGARYLVFTQYTKSWLNLFQELQEYLDSHYKRIRDTDDYVIFDLEDPQSISSDFQ